MYVFTVYYECEDFDSIFLLRNILEWQFSNGVYLFKLPFPVTKRLRFEVGSNRTKISYELPGRVIKSNNSKSIISLEKDFMGKLYRHEVHTSIKSMFNEVLLSNSSL